MVRGLLPESPDRRELVCDSPGVGRAVALTSPTPWFVDGMFPVPGLLGPGLEAITVLPDGMFTAAAKWVAPVNPASPPALQLQNVPLRIRGIDEGDHPHPGHFAGGDLTQSATALLLDGGEGVGHSVHLESQVAQAQAVGAGFGFLFHGSVGVDLQRRAGGAVAGEA